MKSITIKLKDNSALILSYGSYIVDDNFNGFFLIANNKGGFTYVAHSEVIYLSEETDTDGTCVDS